MRAFSSHGTLPIWLGARWITRSGMAVLMKTQSEIIDHAARSDAAQEARTDSGKSKADAVPLHHGSISPKGEEKTSPPRRPWTRQLLFAFLPLVLLCAGYFYVTGGQIVSTDDRYVEA